MFNISITTAFTGAITSALLTAPGADSHMEIPFTASGERIEVTGRLSKSLAVGQRLVFLWALKSDSGAGLYRNWPLTIVDSAATPDGDLDYEKEQEIEAENPIDGDIDYDEEQEIETETPVDGDVDTEPEIEPDGDVDIEPEIEPDSEVEPETEQDTEAIPMLSFVPITAGTFWMGSPQSSTCPAGYTGVCADELGNGPYEVLHEVTLTYNFELQTHELTQREWASRMTFNPSYFSDGGGGATCGNNCPVEQVTWYDVLAYANELSAEAVLTQCYELTGVTCGDSSNQGSDYMACMNETQMGISFANVTLADGATKPQECEGYRLPTEAEWEYTIRSGSEYTAFYSSIGNDGTITQTGTSPVDPNLDQIGWYGGNSDPEGTKPVGGKAQNAWGLYDMSGNVYEWVWDFYQEAYQNDDATDPAGATTGSSRILRGGSWNFDAATCRSALRNSNDPGIRYRSFGVRFARSLP